MHDTLRRLSAAALCAAALAGTGAAAATASTHRSGDSLVVRDFEKVDRTTVWKKVDTLKLAFPTYHPEGIAFTRDHIFLSSTQIIEPTVKFPSPVNGYDRSAGKGIGHLFVMDPQGHLQKDITFANGAVYHPGGIDVHGRYLWVPVAQYRPDSSATIYRVDVLTLQVRRMFDVRDHIGGIVYDAQRRTLVGNTWGSRKFIEWRLSGRQLRAWENTEFMVDYQDCQYAARGKMLCSGITNLPQTEAAGGATATYELGGISLVDLNSTNLLRQVPFQQWSTAGHVATRNPFKMTASGNTLTMRVAPDNGDEGNGTQIITYTAQVG